MNGESTLKKALAYGNAAVEAKPLAAPHGKLPETRVLHSDIITVEMRPGGREIQVVRTHKPGRLEFIPNQPSQHRRTLDAEQMTITYGPENQIQSFRAATVQTQTEPTELERSRKQVVSKTSSKNMSAQFDSKGQMTRMEQWEDFAYQQGDRNARANRAILEADRNLMTLETAARVWDTTGSTADPGARRRTAPALAVRVRLGAAERGGGASERLGHGRRAAGRTPGRRLHGRCQAVGRARRERAGVPDGAGQADLPVQPENRRAGNARRRCRAQGALRIRRQPPPHARHDRAPAVARLGAFAAHLVVRSRTAGNTERKPQGIRAAAACQASEPGSMSAKWSTPGSSTSSQRSPAARAAAA